MFECCSTYHFNKDCPKAKNKKDKDDKDNNKKDVVGTWSDSNSNDSDSEDNHVNLYLVDNHSGAESIESEKVVFFLFNLDSCPKKALIIIIHNMIVSEDTLISETN